MISPAQYDNVKAMLDLWANWGGTGEPLADGAPRESLGAPDARVHSIEDLEIECDKRVVRAVHTCVYELPVMERNAVLMHYGFMHAHVWRAEFSTLFDLAVATLHVALRQKVAC